MSHTIFDIGYQQTIVLPRNNPQFDYRKISMPFQYKRVLVIGATSGIGKALAIRFVQEGSSVIVVGRRKDKLEEVVHKLGKEKATAVPFDITELEKIPNFVTK